MHLLDQLAQSRSPLLLALDLAPRQPISVTGPADYASRVSECPIRYVLGDDLTHAAAHLAFAEGDQLASCLDLVRIPATCLWVEWSDEVHQKVIYESGAAADFDADARGRRVGMLLEATPCGRSGSARTFWTRATNAEVSAVTLSPIETHIDLRDLKTCGTVEGGLLGGGFVRVTDPGDPAMDALLDNARFRFDPRWTEYYRAAARTEEAQRAAISGSLAAVARDVPLLLAFFLLLNARDATAKFPITRDILNVKRRRSGRPPLLDHIEVRASLDRLATAADSERHRGERRTPRLHHVRGHLVRRGNNIFWRSPHVRGRASLGAVRTRTVCLAFEQSRPIERQSAQRMSSGATVGSLYRVTGGQNADHETELRVLQPGSAAGFTRGDDLFV
jgi:hypothetical protein